MVIAFRSRMRWSTLSFAWAFVTAGSRAATSNSSRDITDLGSGLRRFGRRTLTRRRQPSTFHSRRPTLLVRPLSNAAPGVELALTLELSLLRSADHEERSPSDEEDEAEHHPFAHGSMGEVA